MIYSLKKYTDEDFDFVYNTKKVCYQKYVEENFGEWNESVQRKMYDDFLKVSAKDIMIIYVEDERAGFINGEDLNAETYEQGNICLLPKFQGKGIGTALLEQVFEEHKTQNITLRVFKQNPAKRLYERLGFVVSGETKSHYLMKKLQKP